MSAACGQDDLPFGGVGESGMGHHHGCEGFLTFSKLEPPYGKLANRVLAFLTR